jgi:hypothetical protein
MEKDFHFAPNKVRVIKSRRVRWAGREGFNGAGGTYKEIEKHMQNCSGET